MLLVRQQEGHPACKNSVMGCWHGWSEVQICIWPSRCHCHSLSLAPVNPDWFYLPGSSFLVQYWLTWAVPYKIQKSRKTIVCVCKRYFHTGSGMAWCIMALQCSAMCIGSRSVKSVVWHHTVPCDAAPCCARSSLKEPLRLHCLQFYAILLQHFNSL